MTSGRRSLEVLVIGAGMAGLVAAWQAATAGARTRVVSAGWGALYWHAGCIDVLGYHPPDQPVESPAEALGRLEPAHPYTRAGREALEQALSALAELCTRAGYPLEGSLERNWLLPSALGAARPTCLAPATMTAGDLRRRGAMVLVGFRGFADFHPGLIAANLAERGVPAREVVLD
ncbi:MAG: FAD-dependent oxidoreductase, partial [Acidimicrobiia bacterium]